MITSCTKRKINYCILIFIQAFLTVQCFAASGTKTINHLKHGPKPGYPGKILKHAPAPPLSPPVISYAGPQSYPTGVAITPLSPVNTGGAIPAMNYGETTVFAGTKVMGFDDGAKEVATFYTPTSMVYDASGNMYVSDQKKIRKITPAGAVTTLAGSDNAGNADGLGASATFGGTLYLTIDSFGNLFVSDQINSTIRKVTPLGLVTTFTAPGQLYYPAGITIDAANNLYVCDQQNHLIKKVSPLGVVAVFAGNGTQGVVDGSGASVEFDTPSGITIDGSGNLYVVESINEIIRKITPAGAVSTFAGANYLTDFHWHSYSDGLGTAAHFNQPLGICIDKAGNLYVADVANQLVRKVTPAGYVSTLAGSFHQGINNGIGTAARFNYPYGVMADGIGNIYVGDLSTIRKVSASGYTIDKALPAGLTFNSATGTISGTPTNALPATVYTITGYNADGSSTATVSIAVTGAYIPATYPPAPVISYTTPQNYLMGTAIAPLSPTNTGGAIPAVAYGQTYSIGYGIKTPSSIVADAAGNVYITDYQYRRIYKTSPGGVVSVFAGSGNRGVANGTGTAAEFIDPSGIAVDLQGNIYVSDVTQIRKITPSGIVTTVAGDEIGGHHNGDAATASFASPSGIAIDKAGNIFVADTYNNVIREITTAGQVINFAGRNTAGSSDGKGDAAGFNKPNGLAIDDAGNLYVADYGNYLVRKITPARVVTTIAGTGVAGTANGIGTAASFTSLAGISVDASGTLYVSDNRLIRKIAPSGEVSTVAGGGPAESIDGIGTAAAFSSVGGIYADNKGSLYAAEYLYSPNGIGFRRVSLQGYGINTDLPAGLTFNNVTGVISGTPTTAAPAANYIVTGYNTGGGGAASINITVKSTAPVISYPTPKSYAIGTSVTLAPTNTGSVVPATKYAEASTLAGSSMAGTANGTGTSASFYNPMGIGTDPAGNVFITDYTKNVIRKVTPAGVVTTFAGSGAAGAVNATGTAASFNHPAGIAVDAAGNIYVGDGGNNLIRKVTPAGVVSTFAGSGTPGSTNGQGAAAQFNSPRGLAFDAAGNLYVADFNNNQIRKITPAGAVTTLAGGTAYGSTNGTGTAARFKSPFAVTTDRAGNIYVADSGNNLIRKITPGGVVTTFAGSGAAGAVNGTGIAASFNSPVGVTTDLSGNLYVADGVNNLIREVTPAGIVTTFAGSTTPGAINSIGAAARFNNPRGVAIDATGNLYVVDLGNFLIRKILTTGYTISPTTLPAGLTFNRVNGLISGTPTTVTPAADFTVTAYNKNGKSTTVVNIAVTAAPGMAALAAQAPLNFTTGSPAVQQNISPNGDGIADVLIIDNITTFPKNTLQIMNRSGELIYKANGYDNVLHVFTGRSNINGKLQQAGTYFYQLDYNDKGNAIRKTGFIVLKY